MSLTSTDRQLSVPPLDVLEGQGSRALGGGVEDGILHFLFFVSSTLSGSNPHAQLFPSFHQGEMEKGTVELAPPSAGYYSCLFVVWKTSGLWSPVIDLSRLNCLVTQTQFKMETNQSVLHAIRRDDWMVSINLKDVYLQIPIHPDSCQFLSFVEFGVPYQFKVFCCGFSTAPQVFI